MKIFWCAQALVLALLIMAVSGGTASAKSDAGLSGQVLKVVLNEWTLGFTQISAGSGKLTVQTVNSGRATHNLTVQKKGGSEILYESPLLEENKTAAVNLDLSPGQYELYCAVPGHREGGMLAVLIIGG